MTDTNPVQPANNGQKILIIYAGDPPDKEKIAELLTNAGCAAADITLATSDEVASGDVDPKNFDHVIAILDDELASDEDVEAGILAVAQCGSTVIGVWSPEAVSSDMHPAVALYGKAQVPWTPSALASALGTQCPQPLHTSSGSPSVGHQIEQNKC